VAIGDRLPFKFSLIQWYTPETSRTTADWDFDQKTLKKLSKIALSEKEVDCEPHYFRSSQKQREAGTVWQADLQTDRNPIL
jgi:hypothetical protein